MSKKTKHNYPTVFIHGLGGFGQSDGLYRVVPQWGLLKPFDLDAYLNKKGYESYFPSLGPFSGAWDRCCELWAQLMGGTVDYGKVHAEKYGHNRYGRTYEKGLIENWGKKGNHEKINLIGHSFGGPVVKMFTDLILNGCEEEISGTPEGELSDLFKRKKAQRVHSVTTLSGVNNGTLLASAFGKRGMTVITYALTGLSAAIGATPIMKVFDFHLDQWGLTVPPSELHPGNYKLRNPLEFVDKMSVYNSHQFDSVAYEMQIEVCQDLINPSQKEGKDVYYFARRGDVSFNAHPLYLPTLKCDPLSAVTELITGNIIWPHLRRRKYKVRKDWKPNDGMVNVIGQSAPLTSEYTDFKSPKKVKPGIWYNMPVEEKSHLAWAGLLQNPYKYHRYFIDVIDMVNNLG